MPTIVCFGDSNTWGYDPATRGRYPPRVRWVGVLAAELEAKRPGVFTVIAEGQNGRTTLWDDPIEGHKNGGSYLLPCLETHHPVDLLVIMLGTNDLKARFGLTPWDIAHGATRLVKMALASEFGPARPIASDDTSSPALPAAAQTAAEADAPDKCTGSRAANGPAGADAAVVPASAPPKVLLIAPPPLGRLSNFAEMFEGGAEKSKRLAAAFAAASAEVGCELLDAGAIIRSSDRDGVHFDPSEHERLGRAVAARILAAFP